MNAFWINTAPIKRSLRRLSLNWLIVLTLLVPLSGCVIGQQLVLDITPVAGRLIGHGSKVLLLVEDRRELVTSGKEEPWYIGKYRAGFGNPWEVTTQDKVPLAIQLEKDLAKELYSLGFVNTQGGNKLQVLIRDWDFTGYQNGRFWYVLEVSTSDNAGNVLVSDKLEEEIPIRGTLMLGARGGFERDMPEIYERIIRSMIRDNPSILDSLGQ